MIYLDHNATAPLAEEAAAAMVPWLRAGTAANPSSAHGSGREARAAVESARRQVAQAMGVRPGDVTFTSGATEANHLALWGAWLSEERPMARTRMVVSSIEHPAVLEPARALASAGAELTVVPVGEDGVVSAAALSDVMGADVFLVSLMAVNNETGATNDLRALAAVASAYQVPFHTDAAQAPARLPVDVARWGADLVSLSAHKVGGPVGVGALVRSRDLELGRWMTGGSQQAGRRPGTEPVALVAGMGAAFAALPEDPGARLAEVDQALASRVAELGCVLNGTPEARAPGVFSLAWEDVDAEALMIALDRRGIRVSTGAACASGAREPSPVLQAMGLPPERVRGSLRVSMGPGTTTEDVAALVEALHAALATARAARGSA
jgi:cysteine desulfurase